MSTKMATPEMIEHIKAIARLSDQKSYEPIDISKPARWSVDQTIEVQLYHEHFLRSFGKYETAKIVVAGEDWIKLSTVIKGVTFFCVMQKDEPTKETK